MYIIEAKVIRAMFDTSDNFSDNENDKAEKDRCSDNNYVKIKLGS